MCHFLLAFMLHTYQGHMYTHHLIVYFSLYTISYLCLYVCVCWGGAKRRPCIICYCSQQINIDMAPVAPGEGCHDLIPPVYNEIMLTCVE